MKNVLEGKDLGNWLNTHVNKSNFGGMGCSSGFFPIPEDGLSSFGIRVQPGKTVISMNDITTHLRSKNQGVLKLVAVKSPIGDLTDVGQSIANIVNNQGETVATILNKVSGQNFGEIFEQIKDGIGYKDYLKMLSELPQDSFDQFLSSLKKLSRCGYGMDFAQPRNIFCDLDAKKIGNCGYRQRTGSGQWTISPS